MRHLRYRFLAPLFAVAAALVPAVALAVCDAPTHCIPQPTCEYHSQGSTSYPGTSEVHQGLELRNPTHCEEPPAPGGDTGSGFQSQSRIQRSTDGGSTWTSYSGSTTATIRIMTPMGGGPIELELLSLELTGLPPGVMVRESPTLRSQGRSVATPNADGTYHIDSFFDVFTELSLDGGQNWRPSSQPLRVEIQQPGPTPVRAATWGAIKTLYR